MKLSIAKSADTLLRGGVIAYPTEGVFGLGCMPDDDAALARLLILKQRDPDKGLILIASAKEQLEDWVAGGGGNIPDPDPENPTTWIAPAQQHVSPLVRGKHAGVAVRLTTNPTAAAICDAIGGPITSTSANFSGRPVARNRHVLRRQFAAHVDYIVPGDCGPAAGPSEIRDLQSGKVLRPRSS
ncbi:MAG: L-threonylcarbamoyladenylate synthase [Woeseiaceae bacterium]|jgi:L-threonylcarbamoyladenylate synthase